MSQRKLQHPIGLLPYNIGCAKGYGIFGFGNGANAKGEIGEIANKFRPSSSVITSVEPVHLEGFGDIEGVLGAKLEIVTADCKLLFVNGDSPI